MSTGAVVFWPLSLPQLCRTHLIVDPAGSPFFSQGNPAQHIFVAPKQVGLEAGVPGQTHILSGHHMGRAFCQRALMFRGLCCQTRSEGADPSSAIPSSFLYVAMLNHQFSKRLSEGLREQALQVERLNR